MRMVPAEFDWVVDGLAVALMVGLCFAFVASVLLLLRPRLLFMLNERLSRWVDTEQRFRALEKPRQWERFFYRHHRVLGSLISLGAIYVLLTWAFAYDRARVIGLLDRRWVIDGLDWIVAAVETMVVLLHAATLVVGLIILFRPSLLKNIERAANRWHSGPQVQVLDRIYGPVDRSLAVYPRLSGLLLLLASVWSLVVLGPFVQQLLVR